MDPIYKRFKRTRGRKAMRLLLLGWGDTESEAALMAAVLTRPRRSRIAGPRARSARRVGARIIRAEGSRGLYDRSVLGLRGAT